MAGQKPSFATMASSFLARAQQPLGASTASTSQPMFFSFVSEDSEDNIGRSQYQHPHDEDEDEPHLLGGSSHNSRHAHRARGVVVDEEDEAEEDENPYLRLDEDPNPLPSASVKGKRRMDMHESRRLLMDESRQSGGWLAHGMNASSPASSSSSRSSLASDDEDDDEGIPPLDLYTSRNANMKKHARHQHEPRSLSLSLLESQPQLTESLLPQSAGGRGEDDFVLPDPSLHASRTRRKYNDSVWTSAFLFCVTAVYVAAFFMLVLVRKPSAGTDVDMGTGKAKGHTPYTIVLRLVPLLTLLTFGSAVGAYLHVYLLSKFAAPIMYATQLLTPLLLLLSSIWAFVGSFMWEDDVPQTWGESTGLRLFALVPFGMALYTARGLVSLSLLSSASVPTPAQYARTRGHRANRQGGAYEFAPRITFTLPRRILTASRTLNLATRVFLAHPLLLLLSPALLLLVAVASVPFAVVAVRLLLLGYFTPPVGQGAEADFHLRPYVPVLLALVVLAWLWAVMAARGVMRVCAGVCVGEWVYRDPTTIDREPPPLSHPALLHSQDTLRRALYRATQPSLGTICLGALLLSLARALSLCALFIRRLPGWLAPLFSTVGSAVPGLAGARVTLALGTVLATLGQWVVAVIEGRTKALSRYALIHTALTGSPFTTAVRRASHLTTSRPAHDPPHILAPPARLPLLSSTPLLLPLPSALTVYLFVAHTLRAPADALGAAVLSAGVSWLVGAWAVGMVGDVVDGMYLVYCVGVDQGPRGEGRGREEVWEAFEGDARVRDDEDEEGEEEEEEGYEEPRREYEQQQQRVYADPKMQMVVEQQQQQQHRAQRGQPLQSRSQPPPQRVEMRRAPPPPEDEEDIDPFAPEPVVDSEIMEGEALSSVAMGGDMERSEVTTEGGEGEGEESEVFPGSGLFGSR